MNVGEMLLSPVYNDSAREPETISGTVTSVIPARDSSTRLSSVDIVANLFAISDEMREEREAISKHNIDINEGGEGAHHQRKQRQSIGTPGRGSEPRSAFEAWPWFRPHGTRERR